MPNGSKRSFPAALHFIQQPLVEASRVFDVPDPDRFFEFNFAFVDHLAKADSEGIELDDKRIFGGIGQVLFPLRRLLRIFTVVDRAFFGPEAEGYGQHQRQKRFHSSIARDWIRMF